MHRMLPCAVRCVSFVVQLALACCLYLFIQTAATPIGRMQVVICCLGLYICFALVAVRHMPELASITDIKQWSGRIALTLLSGGGQQKVLSCVVMRVLTQCAGSCVTCCDIR